MKLVLLLLLFPILAACTVNLPFNNRLAYMQVNEAKRLASSNTTPVSLIWVPATFPHRVDIQGASGFVGGGSQTRIPTGVALSDRITEALDVSVGVDSRSKHLLEINILKAESKFEYSAGFANVTPGMDYGWCNLQVEFDFDGTIWKDEFTAEERDPTIGASSQTAILERTWDVIAVQVAKSVVKKMESAPKDENYRNSEPYKHKMSLRAEQERQKQLADIEEAKRLDEGKAYRIR